MQLNRLNVLQSIGQKPKMHKELMNIFNCGFYAVDAILRELCSEGLVVHDNVPGPNKENRHLFSLKVRYKK